MAGCRSTRSGLAAIYGNDGRAESDNKRKKMKLLLPLISLLFIISCNHHSQHKNSSRDKIEVPTRDTALRILIYGLPDHYGRQASNMIARKYGFSYFAVAGCMVSEDLVDSVRRENKKVYEALLKRFGKGWRTAFELEVDSIRSILPQIEDLVKKESYIIKKEKDLEEENNGLFYGTEFTPQKNVFDVKAYGWGKINNNDELLVYYTLSVDLKRKSVKLISSTTTRLSL